MKDYRGTALFVGALASSGDGLITALRTFEALGVRGLGAATTVLASGRDGAIRHELPAECVAAQIQEITAGAVGSVMVGTVDRENIVEPLAAALREIPNAKLVLDPFRMLQSGVPDSEKSTLAVVKGGLLPLATVAVFNSPEASLVSGLPIETEDALQEAARCIADMGPVSVLVTGGRLDGQTVTDVLWHAGQAKVWHGPRLDSPRPVGLGDILSAAVAAELAAGSSIENAVDAALAFVRAQLGGDVSEVK